VTLVGRNGAGKSTILNAISGLLPIRDGRVVIENQPIRGWQPHRIVERGVVQVPEGRRVFPRMTAWENLTLGAFTRWRDPAVSEDLERIYELFPILHDRRRQLAGSLSGGEQQMLAIARALMSRPRLLMLDEPSMGLAPLVAQKIMRTLMEINRAGTTLLLVEQSARAALEVASRAYVLDAGRVVSSGAAATMLTDDHVRSIYLGEG
jgi:branched-chain amino acid transport system ATP-binding protein